MNQTALHQLWRSDKAWADRFIPQLKRICGEYLIGEAPMEEDAERNTDLIVLTLRSVRIACRVRKHDYADKYRGQFTVRSERPKGHKTELAKIIEGWGDYFLYAFADAEERHLHAWVLGDLRVFRLWFNREIIRRKGQTPGLERANRDGSSRFLAFTVSELPPDFVVAEGNYV